MTEALTTRGSSTIISSETINSQFTALTDLIAQTLAETSRIHKSRQRWPR